MGDLRGGAGDGEGLLPLRTGAHVPAIGCGTMFLRGSLCEKVVATALGLGYRLVDTASMYGNEREVGEAIRRSGVPRQELFVVSKVKPDDMGYDATLAACSKSCAELGLDYLDAYLVHAPGGSRQAGARCLSSSRMRSLRSLCCPPGRSDGTLGARWRSCWRQASAARSVCRTTCSATCARSRTIRSCALFRI
jgi:diketogulonate reductase-like aldo/keto reductase